MLDVRRAIPTGSMVKLAAAAGLRWPRSECSCIKAVHAHQHSTGSRIMLRYSGGRPPAPAKSSCDLGSYKFFCIKLLASACRRKLGWPTSKSMSRPRCRRLSGMRTWRARRRRHSLAPCPAVGANLLNARRPILSAGLRQPPHTRCTLAASPSNARRPATATGHQPPLSQADPRFQAANEGRTFRKSGSYHF
jgi:hypothetical protein